MGSIKTCLGLLVFSVVRLLLVGMQASSCVNFLSLMIGLITMVNILPSSRTIIYAHLHPPHPYPHAHTLIYTHILSHTCILTSTHTCTHTFSLIYACSHTHSLSHTHTHTYSHTHSHTNGQLHTQVHDTQFTTPTCKVIKKWLMAEKSSSAKWDGGGGRGGEGGGEGGRTWPVCLLF